MTLKDVLLVAADRQHEAAEQYGEIDCAENHPCIFCSSIKEAEQRDAISRALNRCVDALEHALIVRVNLHGDKPKSETWIREAIAALEAARKVTQKLPGERT